MKITLKYLLSPTILSIGLTCDLTWGLDVAQETLPSPVRQLAAEQKINLTQELNKKLSAFGVKKVNLKAVIDEGKLDLEEKLNKLSEYQVNQIFTLVSQMDWLTFLNLSYNHLKRVPDSLGNLSNLKELFLHKNELDTLPSSLGNLSQLTKLHLFHNKLQQLPDSLGRLVNLEYLYLSNNLLTSIPGSLGKLVKLTDLRLHYNKLRTIPASVGTIRTLAMINLQGNPDLLLHGENAQSWGQQELRACFGDRVILTKQWSGSSMKSTTTARQVYDELDLQPLRINRELFTANMLPDIQVAHIFDGEEMLMVLMQILTILNFTDDQSPGYLSYETLASDYSSEGQNSSFSNIEKFWHYLLPRITGYIKTLYNIPLDKDEVKSWNMYEEQVPETQKILTFIMERILEQSDPDIRALWFLQLVNGFLHCPTGQAEAINAVAYAMMDGSYKCKDFKTNVDHILAVKKNMAFTQAILVKGANNSQNVHLPSYYRNLLRKELGLTSAIVSYRERIGVFNADPFSDNQWNVVREFYKVATPTSLIDWIRAASESEEDHADLMVLRCLEEISDTKSITTSHLEQRLHNIKHSLTNPQLDLGDEELADKSVSDIERLLVERRGQLTQELDCITNLLAKVQKSSESPNNQASAKIIAQYLITHKLATAEQLEDWFEKDPYHADHVIMRKLGRAKLLTYLKSRIKNNKHLRPLTVGDAVRYLVDEKYVDPEAKDWWQKYFSANPIENLETTLTQEGIKEILLHRGYLVEKLITHQDQVGVI